MYMIAVQGVGGGGGGKKPFMYNVLDTKGEDGDFLEIWVLNTGFFVHY